MSERLPMVEGNRDGGERAAAGGPDAGGVPAGPGAPEARPQASSIRLVSTLAVAGAVAGFFIVLVHLWSQPRIEAYQARVLGEAVQEVLGGPERTATFYLLDGAFTASPPPTADTAALDRVYVGWDAEGGPVGVAAAAGEPGFQDVIRLIFGFDPGSGDVLGMKVLESKETPGLGDKIVKDSVFVAGFEGVEAPLVGVKTGQGTGGEDEVHMITGATISSQAVIDIINHRVSALEAPLRRLWEAGLPAPGRATAGAQAPTGTSPGSGSPGTPAGTATPAGRTSAPGGAS